MTIHAARDYFEVTVKPTVREFLDNTSDVRKGRLAAIVLFHTWDYLKGVGVKPVLKEEKLMYETVRAAANASKHFKLTSKDHVASNANQVAAEKNEGLFGSPFGESFFGESNDVYLLLDEKEQVKYERKIVVLATAVKFMQDYCDQQLRNLT